MKNSRFVILLLLVLSFKVNAQQPTETELECPPGHALNGPTHDASVYTLEEKEKSKSSKSYRQLLFEIINHYKSSGEIMTWEELENLKVGMIPFRTKPWNNEDLLAPERTKLRTFVNYMKKCLEPKDKIKGEFIKAQATYNRKKQVENFYYQFKYEFESLQATAKRIEKSGKGQRVYIEGRQRVTPNSATPVE